jgi:phage gp46-like protein
MDVMTRYEYRDPSGDLLLYADWQFEAPDLLTDEGMDTAVILSLFTDALASEDDVLPDIAEGDRRGNWAIEFGSLLWLLSREKETEEVRLRAEFYTRRALQWMLDDDVADQIVVVATWVEMGRLDIEVSIYREARLIFSKPYPLVWAQVQANATR